jgi:hypothetical protein
MQRRPDKAAPAEQQVGKIDRSRVNAMFFIKVDVLTCRSITAIEFE